MRDRMLKYLAYAWMAGLLLAYAAMLALAGRWLTTACPMGAR